MSEYICVWRLWLAHRIMQNDAIRPELYESIGIFGVVMVAVVFTGRFAAEWCIQI